MKTVKLAEICKRHKIAPKVARARLRRAGDKVPVTLKGSRWEWPATKEKIVANYISD